MDAEAMVLVLTRTPKALPAATPATTTGGAMKLAAKADVLLLLVNPPKLAVAMPNVAVDVRHVFCVPSAKRW